VTALCIALAGSAGALARYGIGSAVGTRSFPWATLGINLVGSFLLGLLLKTGADRHWSPELTKGLGVGFLGAFTTFSTFSVETQTMLREDRVATAVTYVAVSVVGGVLAAAAGYVLA